VACHYPHPVQPPAGVHRPDDPGLRPATSKCAVSVTYGQASAVLPQEPTFRPRTTRRLPPIPTGPEPDASQPEKNGDFFHARYLSSI
jgi:hypothetical protein